MPFVYPVHCTGPRCTHLGEYKVAARWTDGITQELKTYGLTCGDCLISVYRQSLARQKHGHLAPGETLEPPGIYRLARGHRDDQLQRFPDLEAQLGPAPSGQ